MDNLFEIIVPLIFAAIYFFGNMLSGKSDEDSTPKEPSPRRPLSTEDVEAADRQRRIQEEIRRKIMERRRRAEGGERVGPPPISEQPGRRHTVEAHREVLDQHKTNREVIHAGRTPSPFVPVNEVATPAAEGGFSWDASDDIYEQNMEAQLSRIEATKREAERLRQQAAGGRGNAQVVGRSAALKTGGLRLSGAVRDNLRDPAAARAAFIYGEVLGQPVSLRKSSSVPGLS